MIAKELLERWNCICEQPMGLVEVRGCRHLQCDRREAAPLCAGWEVGSRPCSRLSLPSRAEGSTVCLQQPKDTMRLDETMLVKQLLPEICHFIHTYREGNQHAAELRSSASGVLFSLSCNNFNAVFSRISTRY